MLVLVLLIDVNNKYKGGVFLEEQILNFLKKQHKNRIEIKELILALRMTKVEKLKFLGSIKHFERLEKTYIRLNQRVYCCLQIIP